tara:strand:+ start:392 stop:520 length:129 start_codon:yes stop_codon:yes gene_type:complete
MVRYEPLPGSCDVDDGVVIGLEEHVEGEGVACEMEQLERLED